MDEYVRASARAATTAIVIISVLGGLAIISAVLVGVWLTNRLRRQVGAAAACIQDSSLELEAEADLHATGRRHQPGAIDEVTATISELLIASRRIGDSARQVTEVTDQTLQEAAAGDATLDRTEDAIAAIRAQVDTTVAVTGSGARAIDATAEEYGHLTASLRRIAELVSSAGDAGRDIEWSTKQQSSAVEQITIAVSETARATRETEAAAAHTRKTAAHLSSLSRELRQIVGAAY